MKIKQWIAGLLSAVIVSAMVIPAAAGSDISTDTTTQAAQSRLMGLGIMSGYEDGQFHPQDTVTREQMATIVIKASNLTRRAKALAGTSVFSDVSGGRWSSGYIQASVEKAYFSGMSDGGFHPEETINLAQAATVLVRMLGYTEADLTGSWPYSYLGKADELGITKNLQMGTFDGLPRWAVALMVDRVLDMTVKGGAKTFADSISLYTTGLVLATSRTSDKLASNQVMTDKGTYILGNNVSSPEVGSLYRFSMDGDTITSASSAARDTLKLGVESVVDGFVTGYTNGEKKTWTMTDKTAYWYNGAKVTLDVAKSSMTRNSSLILTARADNSGFETGVIVDPVYSTPEIVSGTIPATKTLGSVNFNLTSMILKTTVDNTSVPAVNKVGEVISIDSIHDQDVVYRVTDIWGQNPYALVVDNKVSGTVNNMLPNISAPKTLVVDSKNYDLAKNFALPRLTSVKAGDSVSMLLGYDGKVVALAGSFDSQMAQYGIVLSSAWSSTFGNASWTVKLLTSSGVTLTFRTKTEVSTLKGHLVTYTKTDDQTVTLSEVSYSGAGTDLSISKDQWMLGYDSVASDVRLFNVISNTTGTDAQVKLISWTDMPSGTIPTGKILHIIHGGAFNDVTLMVLNDVNDDQYQTAMVTSYTPSAKVYKYTFRINGQDVSYSSSVPLSGVNTGTLIRTIGSGSSIGFSSVVPAYTTGNQIDAMDSRRIKVRGLTYFLASGCSVYSVDGNGTVTAISASDLKTGTNYGTVNVYLDKAPSYGGKVIAVVVSQ